MENNLKKYFFILGINFIILLLEILFKISGPFGLMLCVLSIYFIVGSIIRLLIVLNIFDNKLLEELDILFFIK